MAYHTVCKETEIAVGGMRAVKVEGTAIVVYRLDDGFHATQASCTHLFAPLGRGKIVEGCQIQCPFHRARFDIRTGEVVAWASFPPGVQMLNFVRGEKSLRTYPVRVDAGKVLVEV